MVHIKFNIKQLIMLIYNNYIVIYMSHILFNYKNELMLSYRLDVYIKKIFFLNLCSL